MTNDIITLILLIIVIFTSLKWHYWKQRSLTAENVLDSCEKLNRSLEDYTKTLNLKLKVCLKKKIKN